MAGASTLNELHCFCGLKIKTHSPTMPIMPTRRVLKGSTLNSAMDTQAVMQIYFGWLKLNLVYEMGRGGGLVVSILAFYSDNPSSIPAGYLNFLYEKTKMHKKRPGLAHIF